MQRFLGLIFLLLALSACGNIIRIIPADPPPPAAAATADNSYEEQTGRASGAPRRITAEIIALDAPVVEMGWRAVEREGQLVSEWEMPKDEAAWHRNSAKPGEGSNVVISGHNASTGGHVFADLDELQIGDEITLRNDEAESLIYQVVEKNIIRTFAVSPEAQAYLRNVTQATDKEQLTLITCWPRWSNTHRLIVIAEPK